MSLQSGVSPDYTKLGNFQFFIITNATNLDAVSGVMGLGSLASGSGQSYVDQLANAG